MNVDLATSNNFPGRGGKTPRERNNLIQSQ